jgi:streptogramin lyase
LERLRRIALVLAGLTVGGALWAAGAAAEPVGAVESFDVDCSVRAVAAGPDGNVWFTCEHELARPGVGALIGRVTPQGDVTRFKAGLSQGSFLPDIAAGPDGNLWFAIHPGLNLLPGEAAAPGIGRITPQGQITEFRVGLNSKSRPGALVAGPDGSVWFTDGGSHAIGRITPQGAIAEFTAGLVPNSAPGALAVGPDGNLWFTDQAATIGRITPTGAITQFGPPQRSGFAPAIGSDGNLWLATGAPAIARVTPLGAISEFSAGLSPANRSLGPLVAGADGNVWFTARGQNPVNNTGAGSVAIGRIAPSGEISAFTECLHYGPPFTGPGPLAAGPDGNIWFTSSTARSLPNIVVPAAVGRVTPSGQITEVRAGLGPEPGEIVAGADGRMWFDNGGSIGRIAPFSAPANTFLLRPAKRARRNGATRLPMVVPGPGVLQVRPLALLLPKHRQVKLGQAGSATATASACGTAFLRIKPRGAALQRFRRKGSARIKARISFTPTGGTTYTRTATISVYGR